MTTDINKMYMSIGILLVLIIFLSPGMILSIPPGKFFSIKNKEDDATSYSAIIVHSLLIVFLYFLINKYIIYKTDRKIQ